MNYVLFVEKNKTNHENTKQGKHEIIIFSFSCFRPFVIKIFFFSGLSGLGFMLMILSLLIYDNLNEETRNKLE
ncbi:MAG: hypothetical protein B6I30_00945 [Desulfobacteraceae bacterium 4572_187]|nr:MAG: hypothetical protein B6I30_00945 [Desulfobacteraceae bacterium 4572_187]